jgi:pimeloyl-ACP methyl ester carboxylesterase
MIHHQISGTGSNWIVFVHGFTCDSSDWALQVNALEQNYRCLSVDLRGHGKSSAMPGPLDIETHAADVVHLLHTLGISNAVLVGHSMGTRVIAAASVQAPACVGGLVFIDGSIQGSGAPLEAAQDIVNAISAAPSPKEFISNMFSMMFTSQNNSVSKQRIIERATLVNPDQLIEQLRLMVMWDAGRAEPVLSQISTPLVLLQSTTVGADKQRIQLGPGIKSAYIETILALAPHTNVHIIENCGHFIQLEAAEKTNNAIVDCATEVFKESSAG